MSGSGNMIPQSISRMRSSTSTQAQLRPISPRPPRKTTRVEAVTPSERSRPRRPGRRNAGSGDGQFLGGVFPVLELDDAQVGEALAEPAVGGVEEAELAAVGHDLGEE